jgi:hypothetical protein
MGAVKADVKYGFLIGIGVALALMFLGFIQVLILRAVKRV